MPTAYTTRTLDQEPDTIALCPAPLQNHIIVGTYSLISERDTPAHRKGSLQILPFESGPALLRRDFDFGIYDLHFLGVLLGVATSDGRIFFFSLDGPQLVLRDLGFAVVDAGQIVTQFEFLGWQGDTLGVVASVQSGAVRVLQVRLPEGAAGVRELGVEKRTVHCHAPGFEAWCVTCLSVSGSVLVVSGGDDSRLLGSVACMLPDEGVEVDDGMAGVEVFVERRAHGAGVVSVLRLEGVLTQEELLVTGSYDEVIRLFGLEGRPRVLAEMRMPGGMWRVALLDRYCVLEGGGLAVHYVLLVAGHLGGAFVVRLTRLPYESASAEGDAWSFEIAAEFTDGHESLVYACVAREGDGGGKGKAWDIVSSSFYDKKVCNWRWVDGKSILRR